MKINKRIFLIVSGILLSSFLLSFFLSTRFLGFYATDRFHKSLTLVLLAIVFALLFIPVTRFLLPAIVGSLQKRKSILIYSLASTLIFAIGLIFLPLQLPVTPSDHTLEIQVNGDKNALSSAKEIEIVLVRSAEINEKAVFDGDWQKIGDGYFSGGQTGSKLTLTFFTAEPVFLRVRNTPHSGMATMIWDGEAEEVDLYSTQAELIDLKYQPGILWLKLSLTSKLVAGAGVLSWIFSLLIAALLIPAIFLYFIREVTLPSGGDGTPQAPSKERIIRPALAWLLILLFFLVVLLGRYDWAPEVRKFTLRGYFSSAYMLVFTLPVIYYLFRYFFPRLEKIGLYATILAGSILSLPYRWLNLNQFYYFNHRPQYYIAKEWVELCSWLKLPQNINGFPIWREITQPSRADWLPGALWDLKSIPHEILVFSLLFLLGIAGVCLFLRIKRIRWNSRQALLPWLMGAIYILIVIETWGHISMRSPFMYLTYNQTKENQSFYAAYLFPDNKGAVSADYLFWKGGEDHFIGVPYENQNTIVHRGYLLYLSSQISYFISPFYVFLFINIGLWFAAVSCMFLLTRRYWDEKTGLIAAFLTACGSGFIMFVGFPGNYLASYAIVVVVVYLFDTMIASRANTPMFTFILFGLVLGLMAMTYDIFAWYVFIILYSIVRRVSWKGIALMIVISICMYQGFVFLQTGILHITLEPSNSMWLGIATKNLIDTVVHFSFSESYLLLINFFRKYFGHLVYSFQIIPFILAVLGLFTLRDKQKATLVFLLFIPSVLNLAFLDLGKTFMGNFPRFVYIAYPAVLILAALMIKNIYGFIKESRFRLLSLPVLVLLLFSNFAISNIDAFGFPQLYYFFYYSYGGFF